MRVRNDVLVLVVGLGAALSMATLAPGAALAATITVNTTNTGIVNDSNCGLREAILTSNSRENVFGCARDGSATETILLAVNPSGGATSVTYSVAAQLQITRSVIIKGNGVLKTREARGGGPRRARGSLQIGDYRDAQ